MDFSEADFILEVGVILITVPFGFLKWASGYIGYMVRAAKKNRWGLELIRKHADGSSAWEDTFNS